GNDEAARACAEQARGAVTGIEGWRENQIFISAYFQTLTALGRLHQRAGDGDAALGYLREAQALVSDAIARTSVAGLHEMLSQLYREQGDFQRALEHFEQYHHYRTLAEATRHYEQIQVVYQLSNAIQVQRATSRLH